MEAESALAAMFGRLLKHALLRARWRGKNEKFAVGENSIYVEQQQFDFASAGLRRKFCHRKDSSSGRFCQRQLCL